MVLYPAIKKSRHGFKAFLNAIGLFLCLFILFNLKVKLKLPLNTGRVRR
jgi:hypothetical protein